MSILLIFRPRELSMKWSHTVPLPLTHTVMRDTVYVDDLV